MFEQGLVALLEANSGLSALIGTRVYPIALNEQTVYPCLTYQVVSGSTEYAIDGRSNSEKRVQFDYWARAYGAAKSGQIALRNALDDYTGVLSDGTRVLSASRGVTIDFFENESKYFRVMQEFIFELVEP